MFDQNPTMDLGYKVLYLNKQLNETGYLFYDVETICQARNYAKDLIKKYKKGSVNIFRTDTMEIVERVRYTEKY